MTHALPPRVALWTALAAMAAALGLAAGPRVGQLPIVALVVGAAALAWPLLHQPGALARVRVRPVLLAGGALFSASALASLLVAREPSLFSVNLALAPVAAALVAAAAASPRGRRTLLTVLSVALGGLSLLALARWATGAGSSVGVDLGGEGFTPRIFPPGFGHPNQFAAALALLLPLSVAAALASGRLRGRLLPAAAALLGFGALYLTYSRGFWLATAVACLIVAGTRRLRLALAGVGALGALALAPTLVERLFSGDALGGSRLGIWEQAVRVIVDHPFLGVGVENFRYASGSLALPETADAPPHAHDLLLATASEMGVVAALALIVIVAVLLRGLLGALRRRPAPADRTIALGCLGAITAALLGGVTDAVVYHNVQTLMIGAAVLGLAAAACRVPAAPRPPAEPAAPAAARRGGSVVRNFALLAASSMTTRLMTFAVGLALARGLGPSVYGIYALAGAIVILLNAVCDGGLAPYITRETARDRDAVRADLRRLMTIRLGLTGLGAAGVLGWLATDPGSPQAQALAILFVGASLEAIAYLGYAWFQGVERMGFEAVSTVAAAALQGVGGVALAIATRNLNVVLAWSATVSLAQATLTWLRVRRLAGPRPSAPAPRPGLRALAISAGSMMLVVTFNGVILRADSIIIGAWNGARDVGLYTAAYALVGGLQILPWVLAVAMYPLLARTFGRDLPAFRRAGADAVRTATLLTVPAALTATLLCGPIVAAIYGPAFGASAAVLAILVWWVPLAGLSALGTSILRAAGRETTNARIVGGGALLNVAANLAVVPLFGFRAAALVTVAMEAGMIALTARAVRRACGGWPSPAPLLRALPALAGLAAVAVALRHAPVVVAIGGSLLAYAILLVAFRGVSATEIRSLRLALRPAAARP